MRDCRRLFQGGESLILSHGGIDVFSARPTIEALLGEFTSTRFDERFSCQHRPMIEPHKVDRLSAIFASSLIDLLDDDRVAQACEDLLGQVETAIPRHRRVQAERARASGRRDVVRVALLAALLRAADAAANSVIARRISARRWATVENRR